MRRYRSKYLLYAPIPVAAPSKAQVCSLSLAWIAGLNPDGDMCFFLVMTGRIICDGPIPHPEESKRVLWVCV